MWAEVIPNILSASYDSNAGREQPRPLDSLDEKCCHLLDGTKLLQHLGGAALCTWECGREDRRSLERWELREAECLPSKSKSCSSGTAASCCSLQTQEEHC